jgi:hypothetical protein
VRRSAWIVASLAALGGGWIALGGSVPGLFAPARPRNLLLVSLDTVRADHLGSYRYAAAETPRIDALASSGLRFEQATTVVPLTLPGLSQKASGPLRTRTPTT